MAFLSCWTADCGIFNTLFTFLTSCTTSRNIFRAQTTFSSYLVTTSGGTGGTVTANWLWIFSAFTTLDWVVGHSGIFFGLVLFLVLALVFDLVLDLVLAMVLGLVLGLVTGLVLGLGYLLFLCDGLHTTMGTLQTFVTRRLLPIKFRIT